MLTKLEQQVLAVVKSRGSQGLKFSWLRKAFKSSGDSISTPFMKELSTTQRLLRELSDDKKLTSDQRAIVEKLNRGTWQTSSSPLGLALDALENQYNLVSMSYDVDGLPRWYVKKEKNW